MADHVIKSVTAERLNDAQKFEQRFAIGSMRVSDNDWNDWWADMFSQYKSLSGKHFRNVLEVGCGPHTNLKHILKTITADHLYLEDPLINFYLTHNLENRWIFWLPLKLNFVQRLAMIEGKRMDFSSVQLEHLSYQDGMMDLVICINVLDHVQDYNLCMKQMDRVLMKGGILVIGQDLSNETDMRNCPESYCDIGHPIKVDMATLGAPLTSYTPLYQKRLPREQGRNPKAHYSTYLGILEKRCGSATL
jgi:SAM-dependent methyltransferase